MGTTTTLFCDVCGSKDNVDKDVKIPVVWLTEQTEGRYTTPHIEFEQKDVCVTCQKRIVEGSPLTATGAQGYCKFEWRTK